jgi:hypothetical protein
LRGRQPGTTAETAYCLPRALGYDVGPPFLAAMLPAGRLTDSPQILRRLSVLRRVADVYCSMMRVRPVRLDRCGLVSAIPFIALALPRTGKMSTVSGKQLSRASHASPWTVGCRSLSTSPVPGKRPAPASAPVAPASRSATCRHTPDRGVSGRSGSRSLCRPSDNPVLSCAHGSAYVDRQAAYGRSLHASCTYRRARFMAAWNRRWRRMTIFL